MGGGAGEAEELCPPFGARTAWGEARGLHCGALHCRLLLSFPAGFAPPGKPCAFRPVGRVVVIDSDFTLKVTLAPSFPAAPLRGCLPDPLPTQLLAPGFLAQALLLGGSELRHLLKGFRRGPRGRRS